jgi:RNase H-fold protein (predicted Holliday junction resolvase)
MDLFGKVVREYLREAERGRLRTAIALAEELIDERMTEPQVKEMLFASGFDKKIVASALKRTFPKSNK